MEGLELADEVEKKKNLEELKSEFEPLTNLMKVVLRDKIEQVVVSDRIVDSPCVLTTLEYGWRASMERIMKAQALRDNSMTSHMLSKKTMEINPNHSIMMELKKKAAADKSDKTVKDLIWLLFDTLVLTSGFNLDEPTQFAGHIHHMIKLGLGIDDDEGLGDDGDLPPSEEMDGAVDEALTMEELRTEFEPLTKLMKVVLRDKTEQVVVSDPIVYSPCVLTVSKKTTEINPAHSIMMELKKKAAADKPDKTVKDLIWLLFDTTVLTSGFNLDKPTQFARRIQRMIKLGLGIGGDGEGLGDDDGLPPFEEVDGAAGEASKMEEVD